MPILWLWATHHSWVTPLAPPSRRRSCATCGSARSSAGSITSGWYRKALDFLGEIPGRFAFVSTNSIAQGEPVPALFGPIFEAGWRIRFAHRTFAWTSEAPGAAAVHCVIIGFDRAARPMPRLFTYASPKGEASEIAALAIMGYRAAGPSVLVEQVRTPLSSQLPLASMGSLPRDGGNLILGPSEYDEVAADPVAAKYVRRFMMGKELIHDLPRWCLWLEGLDPSDVKRSPVLQERLAAVRAFRAASSAASTRAMATTAHLFGQRSQPKTEYLAIPQVFSEHRTFVTAARLAPDVIAGNKVYKCEDPDGLAFAAISSSMFITWQKTVGGRIKSDPAFSNTLTWNSFPLPELTDNQRRQVIAGGKAVLEARALHPERSLAQHYPPLAMDPALLKAHRSLDTAVDKAFGAKRTCTSEQERQRILFERYAELTGEAAA